MVQSYKGYRIGSIEKAILKALLGVKQTELPARAQWGLETFEDIFKTARQKYECSSAIKKLAKKELVELRNTQGHLILKLTSRGKKIIEEKILSDTISIQKPAQWDKKWRMIMFDIPQKKRRVRDILRFHLKRLGFVQVQGSIWIYPYPCEEIITLIKTYYVLGEQVLYATVESLEGDYRFKKLFRVI